MGKMRRFFGARGVEGVLMLVLVAGTAVAQPSDKTLTVIVAPPGSGTVTGAGTYPHNTVVTVQATAHPGYVFDRWSGALTGDTNTGSVRLVTNKAVTANFLVADSEGSLPGSVTVTMAPPEAVLAGAQWQLDGGPVQNSGFTASGVPVGPHTVTFTDAAGWLTPPPRVVLVESDANTAVTGAYYAYEEADCAAVGACNRAWETAGPEGWRFQTDVSHDGHNALQSGAVGAGESSAVRTTITGPVDVAFWWKVSTGTVALTVNGAPETSILGDVDWVQETVSLGAGLNEIVWTYTGLGTGWLDAFNVAESDPPTGSIEISGGAAATGSSLVSLGLTWDDGDGSGVARMRFSNNGATWSAWRNPALVTIWSLSSGDGLKTVRAQFRDKAGNVSEVYTDTIVKDTAPPTGTIVINGGAVTAPNSDALLTLTWDDGAGSGVARMRFSNNGATWSAWEPAAAEKAWTLAPGSGHRTVRVQFRDRLGNVSGRFSDFIRVAPLP